MALSQTGAVVAWPSLGDAKGPQKKKQSVSAPVTPSRKASSLSLQHPFVLPYGAKIYGSATELTSGADTIRYYCTNVDRSMKKIEVKSVLSHHVGGSEGS